MDPITWCLDTFHEYVVFNEDIFFNILGLLLTYKLMEKTFLDIYITRLTSVRKVYDLGSSVVIVNFLEGVSNILVPVFAYVANVYTGRFRMVVSSTTFCIFGLTLKYMAGNDDDGQLDFRFFYPALVLMALARSMQSGTLQEFIADQFRQAGVVDVNKRRQYAKFWWILASFLAAIIAHIWPFSRPLFRELPLVLMVAMVVFLVVLFYGDRRIRDSHLDQGLYLPELRLKLFALWLVLLILGLVSASGVTFFLLEARELDDCDHLFSILVLGYMVTVTEFVVSETSSYVVGQHGEGMQQNRRKIELELMKIGIGTWFCVLCCILAGVTATHRKYDTGGMMSVYWLIPQFFVLGVMAGLAKNGFKSLYASQVPENLKKYGQLYGESAWGAGSLLSILFIVVLSRLPFNCFGSDLSNSSLHDYYALLAFLSLLNLLIYCFVAFWYIGDGPHVLVPS